MATITIHLDDTDVEKLDALMKRWGFTSREIAASTVMHLLLPIVEQVWTDSTEEPAKQRES